jgi:hypothetical protein
VLAARDCRATRPGYGDHFDIANNSLHEVMGAIDVAEAIGALDAEVAQTILVPATRVKRMIRALTR